MQTIWPGTSTKVSRPYITVLDKMIIKDTVKTLLSVWFVIVVIIVSKAFIRILDKAVDGQVSDEALMTLLSYKTIVTSIELLPASVFMAVLMVIGRMYKDKEISAVSSAGGGSGTIYRAVFLLLLPLSVLTLGLSLYVSPWAEGRMQKLLHSDKQTADIRGIAAGKFSEYSHGDLVFYVEHVDSKKKMHNVFVQQRSKGHLGIINAKAGRLVNRPNGLYMIFEQGERIQGTPGALNYIIEKFDEYAVLIEDQSSAFDYPQKAKASAELWRSADLVDIAELQRRISIPASVLLLAFLAVPLTQISPRGGAYGNIVVGFLIYFTFGNLVRVNQAWVSKGTISTLLGALGINVLFLAIGLLLLARLYGWKWLSHQLRNKVSL